MGGRRKHISIGVVGATLLAALVFLGTRGAAAATEIIPNASVESGTTTPTSWVTSKFGTSTSSFTWVATGGHTGAHLLRVDTTARTSGDAKWYFQQQAITGGSAYVYSDWYHSSGTTQVMMQWALSTGGTQQTCLAGIAGGLHVANVVMVT